MARTSSTKSTDYDPHYGEMMGHYEQIVAGLLDRLPPQTDQVVDVAFALMANRMTDGVSSLTALERVATHNHYRDSAVILRTMFDLHLQFLSLLLDAERLSRKYLLFNNVELFNVVKVFEGSGRRSARA